MPPPFQDSQVVWLLDVLTQVLPPLPLDYQLPSSSLLELGPWALPCFTGYEYGRTGLPQPENETADDLFHAVSGIMEYISACNWSAVFTYIQGKLRVLREVAGAGGASNAGGAAGPLDAEIYALKYLYPLGHLWINGRKLGAVIKEICGHFLNLSRVSQTFVAVLLPRTIGHWINTNPAEFMHLHASGKKLEGGAEILFDMASPMLDDVQLRSILCPFQTALLLLIPDVFQAAGAIATTKGGSATSKKVALLEGLRKGLHSSKGSDTATFCLLAICRVAHHFPLDSDSALLNYALDVQNEIREETFDLAVPGGSPLDRVPDVYFLIVAFLGLSYLNLESVLENVVPKCFQQNVSPEYTLAIFKACKIIAQQAEASRYATLFTDLAPHVRDCLKVCP